MHWIDYWNTFRQISLRYFIVAGIAFLFYYVLLKRVVMYKKIQSRFPQNKDYGREIGYSVITMFIFTAVPFLIIKNPAIVSHTLHFIPG